MDARRGVGGLALVGILLATPASLAQAPSDVTIDAVALDGGPVAVAPDFSTLAIAWTVTFGDPARPAAALASGQATLTFNLECGFDLVVEGDGVEVPLEPGETQYSGTAALRLQASSDAPAVVPQACVMRPEFRDGSGLVANEPEQAEFTLTVDYVGSFEATLDSATRQAGPQKQIPYSIEITNDANARTQYTFELVDQPGGKWNVILPEVPAELGLHATVRGWYISGPSPVMVIAVVGLVLAGRRLARE